MDWLTFENSYVLLVLPAVLFALGCQWLVQHRFKRYSAVRTRRKITGAWAADMICRRGEASHVAVETAGGHLSDHFDPRRNTICLSDGVYDSDSVAAVSIAAHEAGHALQNARGYLPLRIRAAIIPVSQIGSNLAIPLVLAGLVMSFDPLITLGILFFGTAVFFQLVTLPVEFNASRLALEALEAASILDDEELEAAKKVLSAAALTYVAAMAVALAQLLRLVLLSQGRRRR